LYPKEIELCIDELEQVVESAVIGLPDADFGEAVAAVVVQQANRGELTPEQLIEHVKKNLAGYKVPRHIYFVEELPRNTMGKVQKNILRDTYSQ